MTTTATATVSAKQRPGDRWFSGAALSAGTMILVTLAAVAVFLIIQSIPGITATNEDASILKSDFWSYVGPLAFGKPEGEVFLGRELSRSNNYSESTAVEIDAEVRRVVFENYERAKQVILANLDKLKAIAEALLEYETIDTADIDVLMGGGKIDRPPPVRANTSSFSSPIRRTCGS